jgi:hypothetical protein
MARGCCSISVLQEIVGSLRRPSHFACVLQAWDEQIEIRTQTVVLEDECGEL